MQFNHALLVTETVTQVNVEDREGERMLFSLDSVCSLEHVSMEFVDQDFDFLKMDFLHEDGSFCTGINYREY